MTSESATPSPIPASKKHRGPHLGALAIAFTVLFNLGLYFVVSFRPQEHPETSSTSVRPYFPGPWESAETIAAYFQTHQHAVLLCAFFQFCAAIPLGIFTATIVSRMHFLGVRAAGPYIAQFGGLGTSCMLALSALTLWVISYPGIAQDVAVLRALYYLGFAIGGVGYSVPLGLLILGISIPAAFMRLLPKWVVIAGLSLGVIGELSCLTLVIPKALFLIPLTRFPGFVWLIVVGFWLHSTVEVRTVDKI